MDDVINSVARRGRGRPPAFKRADVLKGAGETFWRRGYEGASIVDLTQAMGITPQSLYAAFGSKADLYRETLEWYQVEFGSLTDEALDAPDAIATLSRLLLTQAEAFTDPATPPGCMISTAVLGCSAENDAIARIVAGLRNETLQRIAARLERARSDGELQAEADPQAIARFIGAIVQGMSVQARDGAGRDDMLAVARLAGAELERRRA